MKAKRKNKLVIGVILTIVIGGVLTYQLAYSKYGLAENIDLATGTINNSSDFQMAIKISDDKVNYSDTNIVPTSGYTLNTTNSICKVDNVKDSSITIEYSNGKINFLGATQKGTKCYLYFDKKTSIDNIDDLVAKVQSEAKTVTPDFSQAATTDEGVYSTSDGMYGNTTYYWRGAATTNHVIFANSCWRIVRINGDKTIRIIYNGGVQSGNVCFGNGANASSNMYESTYYYNSYYERSEHVGWTYKEGYQRPSDATNGIETNCTAKVQIEKWYNTNIVAEGFDGKVVQGKFCNDRNMGGAYTWVSDPIYLTYAGHDRKNGEPTLSCNSKDIYVEKIGTIIMDEVLMAGSGKYGTKNNSYYLYNGKHYWTMTPSEAPTANVFYVTNEGQLSYSNVTANYGLRPVINLRSDVTFSSGNGTQNSPYTVS